MSVQWFTTNNAAFSLSALASAPTVLSTTANPPSDCRIFIISDELRSGVNAA